MAYERADCWPFAAFFYMFLHFPLRNWMFGLQFCKVTNFMDHLSIVASVLTMSAIALERWDLPMCQTCLSHFHLCVTPVYEMAFICVKPVYDRSTFVSYLSMTGPSLCHICI